MKTVTIIPQIKILSEYRGKKMLLVFYLGVPLFFIISIFMAYDGLTKTNYEFIIGGILSSGFFLTIGFFVAKGGEYKPNKSYWLERLEKKDLNRYILLLVIGTVILAAILFFINGIKSFKSIGYTVAGLIGLYYWAKSVKFHEDIDYESNQFLMDIIDMQIDEKIIASYQNFDGNVTTHKKNDNIIVITNRKIFFAIYDGTNWSSLNKLINEIDKIGIARNDVNSYLKLVFADKTMLGLRLDVYDKITTTPQLFIKQFLSALDANILGYNVMPKSSRRRVSVSNSKKDESTNNMVVNVRNIELNNEIIQELKHAKELKPGRNIEI